MTSSIQMIENPLLQEKYYQGQVGNLKFYFVPKRGFFKKYAILGVPYGSIDMEFLWQGEKRRVPSGIAHFLEHLLFEQEEGNAFTQFSALSASTNAYTSHTQTAYLFSCTDHFYENLHLLLSFAHTPYFPQELVEKERGVIGEEIDMELDRPSSKVYNQLLEALFAYHPVREEIVGTRESIGQITPKELNLVHQAFYRPHNMVLSVVGDLDMNELKDSMEKFYQQFSGTFSSGKVAKIYPKEPLEVASAEISSQMDISQPYLFLGYKRLPSTTQTAREAVREQMAINFGLELLLGKSSPQYIRLYDQQLIDGGFFYSHLGEKTYSYTVIGGETNDPDKLFNILIDLLEGSKDWPAEKFAQIKNKTLGRFLTSLDSVSFLANEFLDHGFWDFDPFEYPQLAQELTLEEVGEIFQSHFGEKNRARSTLWPTGKK